MPLPPLAVTQQQVFHFAPRLTATQPWPIVICQHEADNFYALPGGRDGELPGAIKLGSDDRDKPTTATTRDFDVDPAARDAATRFVIRRLPGLASTPVNEVTCLYTSTANKDFILDRHGPFVIASACSGHGAKFAPLLGEIIVALSAGNPPGRALHPGQAPGVARQERSRWAIVPHRRRWMAHRPPSGGARRRRGAGVRGTLAEPGGADFADRAAAALDGGGGEPGGRLGAEPERGWPP